MCRGKPLIFNTALVSTIAILSMLVLISTAVTIQSFILVHDMRKVIINLAAEREVTVEDTGIRYRNKYFREGYYAAIMDRKNIKIFEKFFRSKREFLIYDFFEGNRKK